MSFPADRKPRKQGKQPKKFLEQEGALSLAASIVGAVEEKAANKARVVDKQQPKGNGNVKAPVKKSKRKEELELKKVEISARRTQLKKMKKAGNAKTTPPNNNAAAIGSRKAKANPARKSVSFA